MGRASRWPTPSHSLGDTRRRTWRDDHDVFTYRVTDYDGTPGRRDEDMRAVGASRGELVTEALNAWLDDQPHADDWETGSFRGRRHRVPTRAWRF